MSLSHTSHFLTELLFSNRIYCSLGRSLIFGDNGPTAWGHRENQRSIGSFPLMKQSRQVEQLWYFGIILPKKYRTFPTLQWHWSDVVPWRSVGLWTNSPSNVWVVSTRASISTLFANRARDTSQIVHAAVRRIRSSGSEIVRIPIVNRTDTFNYTM